VPFPVLGSQEALHGETYLSTAHVPVSGVTEQLSLGSGMLRPKAVSEKILKKLVEAEPLALGVEWDKEHRLMFELFEEELGLLQAGELPTKSAQSASTTETRSRTARSASGSASSTSPLR